MHQYSQMEDEQLAKLFQSGDDDAFTELFSRYEGSLIRLSKSAAKRFPNFYEDEFHGYFQERFIKLVREFDTTLGVYFAYFCKFKFPKLAHDYVRGKLFPRDKDGNVYRSVRDKYPVYTSDLSNSKLPDVRFTSEYQQGIEDTDLFQYLGEKNPVYQKVIALISKGYGYSEIATYFGKTGTDVALRNWTSRIVNKVRHETVKFYEKCDCIGEISSYAN